MKKYALHFIKCALVTVLTLTAGTQPTQAQEPAPSTWNSFINSAANPIISDTFRMQTFAGKEMDNWKYTLSGGAEVTNELVLKLPLGSKAVFEPYPTYKYTKDTIGVRLAFDNILKDEKIFFQVIKQEGATDIDVIKISQADSSSQYKMKKLGGSPSLFNIKVSQPTEQSKSGYYWTNNVFAYGSISQYSLFTGTGNWNDTTRWSHLPPLRHRKALINGEITTHTNIQCENTAINNGSLHISPGTTFSTNGLILYTENSTLSSEGGLSINGPLTVQKTFAEKGKWYFISFPFDVYASNIASPFVQKDATPNHGGDFFYIQSYNGNKRATSNKASGNWEVLPICSANTPVFEKNKGYLIALDEKATTQTLTFSSKPGDSPSDFARNGCISVSVSSSNVGTDKDNQGWYLCGNPFPGPLKLSELENTSTLDGYVYIFQNGSYKAYPINSDYAIPPYSAFFVKSSGQAEIRIYHNQPFKSTSLVEPSVFSHTTQSEPYAESKSTNTTIPTYTGIRYNIKNNILTLENIPEAMLLKIYSLTGNCLLNHSVQEGSSIIPLPLKAGVYLIKLQTPEKQETKKVIIL